mmetsp:Transcript_33651/g.39201  ORF Transcript_33651/g.39201 Transcript_33651/m.39201 type:complete len:481 (-) Transcript_33651:65-1507(-)
MVNSSQPSSLQAAALGVVSEPLRKSKQIVNNDKVEGSHDGGTITSSSSTAITTTGRDQVRRGGGRISGGRGADAGRFPRKNSGRGRESFPSASSSSSANAQTNQLSSTNCKSHMAVCTFFLSGRCHFGGSCRFYHPDNVSKLANDHQQTQQKARSSRQFDVYKAEAISMAKTAQDLELQTFGSVRGPFFSIDIECAAIGYGHSNCQRYPCRVSLVKGLEDQEDVEVLLDEIVNLRDQKVVSYMTALTGMTVNDCLDKSKMKLEEIRSMVKHHLSSDVVLVGHSIDHDVEWLGLKPGVDFREAIDTSLIFRQRIPRNLGSASNILRSQVEKAKLNQDDNLENKQDQDSESGNIASFGLEPSKSSLDLGALPDDKNLPFPTRYRTFSLRHCCKNLLYVDIQKSAHNPIMDAKYSLLLYHKYRSATPEMLRAVRDSLHRAPVTASFASENPVVDGVVLSPQGYKLKWAARSIWRWWVCVKDRK